MALDNNQINSANIDNDEISLKELFFKIRDLVDYLKSKWKIIVISGIIGGLIGFTIVLFDKPTYKAVLTFAMEEDKGGGGLGGAAGLASSFGIDIGGGGGGAFAASNITELMKSKRIVYNVLLNPIVFKEKTISLVEYYIQANNLRKNWDLNPSLKSIQFLPNDNILKYSVIQDSILQSIYLSLIDKKRLTIYQKDKKATILSIEFIYEDQMFAKVFCEKLAQETSAFYIETKSKKSKNNLDILQKQVDSVKNELNSSITGVASETDNFYNLNPAFVVKGTGSKKKQIDVQANTAILTNLVVQLELAKITLRKETPLIQLIDQPRYPLEKNKLGKIKSVLIGIVLAELITIFLLIMKRQFQFIL